MASSQCQCVVFTFSVQCHCLLQYFDWKSLFTLERNLMQLKFAWKSRDYHCLLFFGSTAICVCVVSRTVAYYWIKYLYTAQKEQDRERDWERIAHSVAPYSYVQSLDINIENLVPTMRKSPANPSFGRFFSKHWLSIGKSLRLGRF